MSDFISFENVEKIYRSGEVEIKALGGVSFGIKKGEICVIVGASGAGKTTLLNILGGMDTLTSGRAVIDGADISSFGRKQLASYRRFDAGFVFQFYNLVPNLTARENVQLASQICRDHIESGEALKSVGLEGAWIIFPLSFRAASSRGWR